MIVSIIGSSGLVGSNILNLLLNHPSIDQVISFGRRPLALSHDRLSQIEVDFSEIQNWGSQIRGDLFFSSLGTTLAQAGSKEAQYKVDYSYQLHCAQWAKRAGVRTCTLISSAHANPTSPFFYTRMKGSLENEIKALDFEKTVIARPGPLQGERNPPRPSEDVSVKILNSMRSFLPRSLRPILADQVAKAVVHEAMNGTSGVSVLEPEFLLTYNNPSSPQ